MNPGVHIKFVDSDDEDMQVANPPAAPPPVPHVQPIMAHVQPASVEMRCSFTIRTDYGSQDQCYVFQLVPNAAGDLVAATLSNRVTKLYAVKDAGLQYAGDLPGHTGRITDARFALPAEPSLLHTSSVDGSVRGWDVRSGREVERFQAPGGEALCLDTNGTLVAGGVGDRVLFWDRRTGRPAAAFTDTHAQDVTQVAFHPAQRGTLVSASEDGLVAVFTTSGGLDEDEGFTAALNIDTSVARMGFYGPEAGKLWCCSSTETLHLWDWAAACDDAMAGGNGALGQAAAAREGLTAAGSGTAMQQGVDYLISCEYNTASDQLFVMAGNSEGAAGVFPVREPQSGDAAAALAFGAPVATLIGTHTEVVRSVLWQGAAGPVCLSAGEDARVCVWSVGGTSGNGGSSSDSAVRRQGQGHMRRASPY